MTALVTALCGDCARAAGPTSDDLPEPLQAHSAASRPSLTPRTASKCGVSGCHLIPSDMLDQSLPFASWRAALKHVAGRKYDLVFATSSRLMTAALGAWIARAQSAPLYLDIRDLFVDTISDVLPAPLAWPVRALMGQVESWTMRRAQRINLVSRQALRKLFPAKRYGG